MAMQWDYKDLIGRLNPALMRSLEFAPKSPADIGPSTAGRH